MIFEAVLAENKRDDELLLSVDHALRRSPYALVTRCDEGQVRLLKDKYEDLVVKGRTVIVGDFTPPSGTPSVGIIAAGTSDLPVVEEAELTLMAHGVVSRSWVDVGVAHLQRTTDVLAEIEKLPSIRILILVAGHEGALFTVVSGLTKLPCIAVPSPRGYGEGGVGRAALLSALQSCSPGIVTVNIGNGFGAASFCVKVLGGRNE